MATYLVAQTTEAADYFAASRGPQTSHSQSVCSRNRKPWQWRGGRRQGGFCWVWPVGEERDLLSFERILKGRRQASILVARDRGRRPQRPTWSASMI